LIFENLTDELTNYKLQDICLSITDGKHGDCINEQGSDYFFLSAKDIQNQALRKTRDLLLPRLISGRLDVEDLDIEV